jgi:hypothetical protein
VLALLAAERERPLAREELAEELWAGGLPPAWEPALRAVISKLRGALAGVGLDRDALSGAFGVYRLRLPPRTWVDLEAAAGALHRAETLARAGQVDEACGWALAARAIGARPLLPGAQGPWVARRRARLRDVHRRSLAVLAYLWVRRGEPGLAVADAEEALRLEPSGVDLSHPDAGPHRRGKSGRGPPGVPAVPRAARRGTRGRSLPGDTGPLPGDPTVGVRPSRGVVLTRPWPQTRDVCGSPSASNGQFPPRRRLERHHTSVGVRDRAGSPVASWPSGSRVEHDPRRDSAGQDVSEDWLTDSSGAARR